MRRTFGTACKTVKGYLPYISYNNSFPKVNEWLLLTGGIGIGTTTDEVQPPITALWLVAHEKLPNPFMTPFTPGCQMLIKPFTMLPVYDRDPTKTLPVDGRLAAWREGSTAYLLFRPEPAFLGRTVYVQLVVAAPGENTAGALISHVIEIIVGDSTWREYAER